MREKMIKAFSLFTPMALVCWYVDEPGAALIVGLIGFVANLELIKTKIKNNGTIL